MYVLVVQWVKEFTMEISVIHHVNHSDRFDAECDLFIGLKAHLMYQTSWGAIYCTYDLKSALIQTNINLTHRTSFIMIRVCCIIWVALFALEITRIQVCVLFCFCFCFSFSFSFQHIQKYIHSVHYPPIQVLQLRVKYIFVLS